MSSPRMDAFEVVPPRVLATQMTLANLEKIIYTLPPDFEVGYSSGEHRVSICKKGDTPLSGGRHDMLVLDESGDIFILPIDEFEARYKFVDRS